ncbi:DgyrCDS2749 [Dimorphilus gyrociliatus]|uniref:Non-structural maintenance of chromosomes element 1 homolog n=1 Tax=Dimorphilus gyrociliatus TaxID=2664684 RepID=A0A7I8VBT1_9ANNE|nr:DgyrCDS2749 [Dimorphilus gyrociliatus]
MNQYGVAHVRFLQKIMSKSFMYGSEVKEYFEKCLNASNIEPPDDLKEGLFEFIKAIKLNIMKLNYDIERSVCEKTGRSCYVFCCKKESFKDTIKPELRQFLTAIINQIVDNNGRLGNIAISNIGNSFNEYKLSAGECDGLCREFIKSGWLIDDDNCGVVLSPRALIELKDDLKDRNVPDCNGCKTICVLGDSCQHCETKMHFRCAKKLFGGDNGKCPNCSADWIFS